MSTDASRGSVSPTPAHTYSHTTTKPVTTTTIFAASTNHY